MSSAPFPERIDAVKMFARMGSITADLPLARLQRFSEQLSGDALTRAIAVDLQFGRDEEGRRLLSAKLDGRVPVACQRCLQGMELELHSELSLLVFDTEEELEKLPTGREGSREGVVMTEDGLDVVALIEDELLLSLPMIPMHDDPSCNRVLNQLTDGGGAASNESRPNPFAVLASLKTAKADKARPKAKPGKKT
jgi:uncharacterized protein